MSDASSRSFGLDVVRSLAIILVLISHSAPFFVGQNLSYLSFFGVLGVEVFFVLSGFLIGSIILQGIVREPALASLTNFYLRRWLRTLPLYYLVLFLNSFCLHISIPMRNFVFLQNFDEKALGFLAVSWSLSIEEWFYLLFPAILFLSLKLLGNYISRKTLFFGVAILIGAASFFLRTYTAIEHQPPWDYGVRKQVFLRLDSIMTGVILVGIKEYYKEAYAKFTATTWPSKIALSGFIFLGFLYIGMLDSGNDFTSTFWKIFMFTAISLTCAAFVAWLESSEWLKTKGAKNRISPVFVYFSRTSYGIYLVHFTILFMVLPKVQGFIGLLVFLALSLSISTVLNKFYENPIMNLRDRIRLDARPAKSAGEAA